MSEKYIFSTSSTVSDLNKKLIQAKGNDLQSRAKTKISITVLSNVSTQYLVNSLYTSLIFNEILPDIYESSFDQWEFELNNPESETHRNSSDYILLVLSSTRLITSHYNNAHEFAVYFKKLIINFKEKNRGEIIITLPESIRAGFDHTSYFYQFVKSFRNELQSELENIVQFIDIDPLIMEFGFEKWNSSKFLVSAKLCCHPNCFPLYGNYLSCFIQSLLKRPTRLVITDLDNTLWDGIVGDLGWEGIGLDKDANGYPHIMLQKYLLSLKESGVLLAISSKNSLEEVKKVFDNRREMILTFDDFIAHEINWAPKSENIKRILNQLNLTTTGILFLDDTKFEREEVKNSLPEMIVPELPENVEEWCEFLSKSGYLSIGKVNKEDLNKSRMYHAEKKRKEDAEKYTDYSDFLKNLNLVISPEKVSSSNFDRVLELIHKTNQFNLTTKRLSVAELERFSLLDNCFCYCYSLKDKYSDYGIISVFIAERISANWEINTWLMSCRAMGRGVEYSVFNHFITTCLTDGEIVFGEYIPTGKNKPIENLLKIIGFTQVPESGNFLFTCIKNKNQNDISFIEMAPEY